MTLTKHEKQTVLNTLNIFIPKNDTQEITQFGIFLKNGRKTTN